MEEHDCRDGPVRLFYSYAHEDEKLLGELRKHLRTLERFGIISGWHDREIPAGGEWHGAIEEQLSAAEIVVLLLSADFLNSDYCTGTEMLLAVDRHKSGDAVVVPVILRECMWKETPLLAELNALPRNGKAVASLENPDQALTEIAREIKEIAVSHRQQRGFYPRQAEKIGNLDQARTEPYEDSSQPPDQDAYVWDRPQRDFGMTLGLEPGGSKDKRTIVSKTRAKLIENISQVNQAAHQSLDRNDKYLQFKNPEKRENTKNKQRKEEHAIRNLFKLSARIFSFEFSFNITQNDGMKDCPQSSIFDVSGMEKKDDLSSHNIIDNSDFIYFCEQYMNMAQNIIQIAEGSKPPIIDDGKFIRKYHEASATLDLYKMYVFDEL